MDLSSPWVLFSGLLIGSAGLIVLVHGKRNADVKAMTTGLVLCVFPYFVSSLALLWLGAAACLGGLYAWSRADS